VSQGRFEVPLPSVSERHPLLSHDAFELGDDLNFKKDNDFTEYPAHDKIQVDPLSIDRHTSMPTEGSTDQDFDPSIRSGQNSSVLKSFFQGRKNSVALHQRATSALTVQSAKPMQKLNKRIGLVVDGDAIAQIVNDKQGCQWFYEVAVRCHSCVACRLSPMQKKQIVEITRKQAPRAVETNFVKNYFGVERDAKTSKANDNLQNACQIL
jgi:hypothetical protein